MFNKSIIPNIINNTSPLLIDTSINNNNNNIDNEYDSLLHTPSSSNIKVPIKLNLQNNFDLEFELISKNCTSNVWNYFKKIKNQSSTLCIICANMDNPIKTCIIFKDHNTSSMQKHLKKHNIYLNIPEDKSTKLNQISIDEYICAPLNSEDLLLNLIVQEDLPMCLVESEHFRKYQLALNSRANIMGRDKLKNLIIAKTKEIKKCITLMLENQYISFTCDKWTSLVSDSYFGITAHYIDKNWELKNLILNCSPTFNNGGTAVDLADEFKLVIDDFELKNNQLVAMVTDTEATMNLFRNLLKDQNSMIEIGCIDHLIQLVSNEIWKSNSQLLERLRSYIGKIKRSPKILGSFKKIQEAYGGVGKVLIGDCITRWWSTYQMVERFVELKKYILFAINENIFENNFDDSDWIYFEDLTVVLKPFMELQKFLEGEKYVTISFVLYLITSIRNKLNTIANHYTDIGQVDHSICVTTNALINKFNDEFGNGNNIIDEIDLKGPRNRPKGLSKYHIISCLLDPRFKVLKSLTKNIEDYKNLILEDIILLCNTHNSNSNYNSDKHHSYIYIDDEDEIELNSQSQANNSNNNNIQLSNNIDLQKELNDYLSAPRLSIEIDNIRINPLQWWKDNQHRFPNIALLARKILAIPATSASSERLFSSAGLVITEKRNRLNPNTVESIIFLKENWELIYKKE